MKRWLVSYTVRWDLTHIYKSTWIEVHGETLDVEMMLEDIKTTEKSSNICILSIFPSTIEPVKVVTKVQTEKSSSSKKKSTKPELGQNRAKIIGPLPEELKHLTGLEADIIGEDSQFYVLLTPAGLFPQVPKSGVKKI